MTSREALAFARQLIYRERVARIGRVSPVLAVAGVLALAGTASAQELDMRGTWSCCGDGGAGQQDFKITSQNGSSFSGTAAYPNGGGDFSPVSGTISGSNVSLTTGPYYGSSYSATFTGTVGGDTMSGTWESNAAQSGTWTATRIAGTPGDPEPTDPDPDPEPAEPGYGGLDSVNGYSKPSRTVVIPPGSGGAASAPGGKGLSVFTEGACTLTISERRAGGRAGAAAKRKKKGLIKQRRVFATGAGRWVLPLKLTKKGKKAVKRKRRGAKSAANVNDPVNVKCTPVRFPTVNVGGGAMISGIGVRSVNSPPEGRPQIPAGNPTPTGGAASNTPTTVQLTPTPEAEPVQKIYSGEPIPGGGSGMRVTFTWDGRRIRGFTTTIPMTCSTVGGDSRQLGGTVNFNIESLDFDLNPRPFGIGYVRSNPDYLTISGSIDRTTSTFRVAVARGFSSGGNVVQCGGGAIYRANPLG